MNKTEKTPADIHKEELAKSQAATGKWRRRAVEMDEELQRKKEAIKKYIDIYTTLTHILIRSNPFRMICSNCSMSTYVYLVVNHKDGTSHIQEVAGCFCPYCGERAFFGKEEEK